VEICQAKRGYPCIASSFLPSTSYSPWCTYSVPALGLQGLHTGSNKETETYESPESMPQSGPGKLSYDLIPKFNGIRFPSLNGHLRLWHHLAAHGLPRKWSMRSEYRSRETPWLKAKDAGLLTHCLMRKVSYLHNLLSLWEASPWDNETLLKRSFLREKPLVASFTWATPREKVPVESSPLFYLIPYRNNVIPVWNLAGKGDGTLESCQRRSHPPLQGKNGIIYPNIICETRSQSCGLFSRVADLLRRRKH
jgi:hypothetical protein